MGQTLKDEAAKLGGMQREVNRKNGELTHPPEVLEDVDIKRAHSTPHTQQPSPPYTLFVAPTPTSPGRVIVSPARA